MKLSYRRSPARVWPTVIVVATSLTVATSAAVAQQPPTYPTPTTIPTYPGPTYPSTTYPAPPSYPGTTYPQTTYPAQPYTTPAYGGTYGAPGYPGEVSPIRGAFLATVVAVVGSGGGALLSGIAQFIVGGILNWFKHKPHPPDPSAAMQTAPAAGAPAGYGYPAGTYPPVPSPNSPVYGGNTYPGAPAPMAAPSGVNQQSTYPAGTYPYGTYPGSTSPGMVSPAASPVTGYPVAGVPTYPAITASPPTGAYPGGVSSAATTNPYQPGIPNSSPTTAVTTAATPPSPYGAPTPYGTPNPYAGATPYGGTTAGVTAPATGYPAGTYLAANTGSPTTRDAGAATVAPGTASTQPTLYAGLAYEVHLLDANGGATVVDTASYAFHSGDRFVVHFRPSLPGQMEVYNINASGKRTRIDSTRLAAGQLTTLGPYQFTGDTGDESLKLVLTACSTPDLLTRTRDIVNVGANASSGAAIHLAPCGTTTRGIETRDIQKVALDQSTSFALDPLSPSEVASGQVAPREFFIQFHHQ